MTRRTLLAILLFALIPFGCSSPQHLIVCGMEEVFIIDAARAERGDLTKIWSWRAKDRPELPAELHAAFRTTDDCKPVAGGTRILISSSSGACALVEHPSGKVLWYARVPNAHSIELLPNDRIVAAASTHAKGNRLMLFDITRPDAPLFETPLPSAHGVVWDNARQHLWALGYDQLQCYDLGDWQSDHPSLKLRASHPLPDAGGHDLLAVPESDDLVLSVHKHVYLFDRKTLTFRPHPELGDLVNVKCVSPHPTTGRVAHLRGEGKEWWSTRIHLLAPQGEIQLPDERMYKARWMEAPSRQGGAMSTR
ncbi:MAG: DUF6528 family protein [Phycisphaeraceae bacterium]